jgi:O-antigen ligase
MDPRGEDDRSAARLIAVAIVTLPVLWPTGPGRSTPADVFMGLAILGTLVWAGTYRVPVRLPYLVPISILVVAGLVASMVGEAPRTGFVAVVQDVFLFAWAAAIANVIRVPANLSIILGAWAWGATAWACLLIVGTVAAGLSQLVGAAAGSRGQLWFDNPNMAAAYFMMSLFVMLLGRHPRNRFVRALGLLMVLTAMLLTGSNGALLSLLVGGAAAAFVAVWRRTDLVVALAGGTLAVALVAGLAYVAVDGGVLTKIQESSHPLVERSLARGPRSAEGRTTLFLEELELYRSGSLLGRGPASTKDALESTRANLSSTRVAKEAHNDYLATLVERGVIGALGLVLLVTSIGVMAYSVALRPLSPAFARRLANPSVIVGAGVAMALFAVTHEVLHYRFGWAFLGILAGLYLFGREAAPASGGPSGREELVAASR